MKFQSSLIRGTLIRRYKRFLSDHELLDGKIVTAHVANPGSMLGLMRPGMETWLSISDNPKRKLKYSWELVRVSKGNTGLVGINTHHPNNIAEEAIIKGNIPQLSRYKIIKREVKYGTRNSRVDILLENEKLKPAYVEVKNVTLRRNNSAEFPDSITTRGTKHLNELKDIVDEGNRAIMLYIVQRGDCNSFRIAADIDPLYYNTFCKAVTEGLEAFCYTCDVSTMGLRVNKQIPIIS